MADINYSFAASVSKGALAQSFAASGITASMATAGLVSVTLDLNTNVTTISTANINQLGLCIARSLATTTTHTVSFGRYEGGTLYESVTLKAGEGAILPLSAGNYAAKAAVAGTRLVLQILEG